MSQSITRSKYEQELEYFDPDFHRLQLKVGTEIPQVEILSIRKVENKYLSSALIVKKSEMNRRIKTDWNIEELIHATGAHKIPSILKKNLNWRLVMRGKFGRGVSFSPRTSYANKYCNNRNGHLRAFIFCDVLVGNEEYVYDNDDDHPVKGVDSYRSRNHCVLIKFDDFTFNPTFIVYYVDKKDDSSPYDFRIYPKIAVIKKYSPVDRRERHLLRNVLRIPLHDERPPFITLQFVILLCFILLFIICKVQTDIKHT